MIRIEVALKNVARDFNGRFKVTAGYGDPLRIICTPPFSINGVMYILALSVQLEAANAMRASFNEIYINNGSVFSIAKNAKYDLDDEGIKELQDDAQAHLDLIMAREARNWEK